MIAAAMHAASDVGTASFEFELSPAVEIGADSAYLLAEQTALMEDAQAAEALESEEQVAEKQAAELEGQIGNEDPIDRMIAGVIGQGSEAVVEAVSEQAAEPVAETATPVLETLADAVFVVPEIAIEAAATASTATATAENLPQAVRDFSVDLRDAVLGVQAAQEVFDDLKEQMKEARDELKAAQKRFLRVGLKGIETFPLFDQVVKQVNSEVIAEKTAKQIAKADEARPTAESQAPTSADESAATIIAKGFSDSWRSAPISVLADHGLSKKVIESLVETHGVRTIGALEDARADTFNRGLLQFKGIGQGKADKIEQAVIDWLSENRDAGVLAQVKADAAEVESVVAAEHPAPTPLVETVSQVQEPEASEPETKGPAAQEPEPTENTPEALLARAAALKTGKKNSLAPHDDEGCWDDGQAAFERGDKLTDCNWLPGKQQDDWLRGWMAAEVLSKEE